MLHATEDGVTALQARFSTWLRTLSGEARFLCWQMPATLDDKIAALDEAAETTDDEQRRALLIEYRREYERMNTGRGVSARAVRDGAVERPESARTGGRTDRRLSIRR